MQIGMELDEDLVRRAFEPLVAAARGNGRALLALAAEAARRGDQERCYALAKDAADLMPDDPATRFEMRALLSRYVPGWHFPMMQDEIRNRAFQEAIERAVRPDLKVLDIGSGSGLLAMMAARAGAREVHSCEMNPAIAATAKEIVERNGYADQVTIHARSSRKIDADTDLGGRADLVISEIIGKDLVSEKVLPSLQDAVRRLAKPDARFIPQGGQIRVALVHHPRIEERKIGTISGFDLSPFNLLEKPRHSVPVNDPALTLRGDVADLFSFDFTTAQPQAEHASLDLVASGGIVNAVAQWFRLQLDEVGSFENSPGPNSSQSWALVLYPFAQPIETVPGQRIAVVASVAGDKLSIRQA